MRKLMMNQGMSAEEAGSEFDSGCGKSSITCSGCKDLMPPTFFGTGADKRCHSCRREAYQQRTLPPVTVPNEQRCAKCDLMLPASSFRRIAADKSGLYSACRQCENARKRLRHSKMRDNRLPPTPAVNNPEKRCTKCGLIKSRNQFQKDCLSDDRLFRWCRSCKAAHSAHSRKLHSV